MIRKIYKDAYDARYKPCEHAAAHLAGLQAVAEATKSHLQGSDSAERAAGEAKPHPFPLVSRPSDDMLYAALEWLKQTKDGADNLGIQLKATAADYAVRSLLLAPSSPAVPDSVREAVARFIDPVAFNTGPEAFGIPSEDDPAWKQTLPYGARLVAAERADKVIALLSAPPAGQSTGQGADVKTDAGRLLKEALFACLKEGTHDQSYGGVLAADGKKAWVRFSLVDAETSAAWAEGKPAPDSTRTGENSILEAVRDYGRAELFAGGLTTSALTDARQDSARKYQIVVELLATRSAVPEAQGAWVQTPVPSSPGVPNSVRVLSEAATQGEWAAHPFGFITPKGDNRMGVAIATGSGDPQKWPADRAFIIALVNWLRSISARPGGQISRTELENAEVIEPLHLVTQRGQPYGSVRRCCEVCGRMCWRGKEGSAKYWIDDPEKFEKSDNRCDRI